MDTNETKEGKSECEQCGWCGWCGGHGMGGMNRRRHLGHIIVKIFVALFIFWCGVQFGELKGLLHGGYGYGMMGSYSDGDGQNYFYRTAPGGMMGGWAQQGTATQ